MYKTASTHTQRKLMKNQDLLQKNGVLIPACTQQDNTLVKDIVQERWEP